MKDDKKLELVKDYLKSLTQKEYDELCQSIVSSVKATINAPFIPVTFEQPQNSQEE